MFLDNILIVKLTINFLVKTPYELKMFLNQNSTRACGWYNLSF